MNGDTAAPRGGETTAPRLSVGVSGWSRPEWEPLWPVSGDEARLALLMRTFGCLEFDTTRFAAPGARTVARWRAALRRPDEEHPAPCRLLVEVPATLLDAHDGPASDEAARFTEVLRPLLRVHRLGALVARYDVSFLHGPSEVRRLARVAAALAPSPVIVELRHPSWWDPRALDALRGIGVALAHVDGPPDWRRLPARHAPTASLGMLRVLGRAEPSPDAVAVHHGLAADPGDHRYAPPEVGELAQRARSIAAEVDTCFVVAANAPRGHALALAFELRWLLGAAAPAPAWPPVEGAFPDLASLRALPPVLPPPAPPRGRQPGRPGRSKGRFDAWKPPD